MYIARASDPSFRTTSPSGSCAIRFDGAIDAGPRARVCALRAGGGRRESDPTPPGGRRPRLVWTSPLGALPPPRGAGALSEVRLGGAPARPVPPALGAALQLKAITNVCTASLDEISDINIIS
ncbi:hypothetical protein EVAR_63711_1 [Eumeta japonica]|uniref:Uncharacterized protein n=1 Tax=Eumeta variegata TaxID=151549 RepID=A0A4C1ZX19_EUMVA|nr:hypothetical protein EVAR_63711_1 [Eumeta japonica]